MTQKGYYELVAGCADCCTKMSLQDLTPHHGKLICLTCLVLREVPAQRCHICGRELPEACFRWSSRAKARRRTDCKFCVRLRNQASYRQRVGRAARSEEPRGRMEVARGAHQDSGKNRND